MSAALLRTVIALLTRKYFLDMQMHRRERDRGGERACVCALKTGGWDMLGWISCSTSKRGAAFKKVGVSTLCASEFRHIHCARLGVSHCVDVCAHACVLYLRDLLRRCVTVCVWFFF